MNEAEVELLLAAAPVPADQLGSDGLRVRVLGAANQQNSLRPGPGHVVLQNTS